MARIAHLSDFHLLEPEWEGRRGEAWWRLQYLSAKRRIDGADRRRRALEALVRARSADHLVLTGDLTEDAMDVQFETVAEVLRESGWDPDRVTLVPGNHDAYEEGAWSRALAGPLAPYARSSAPGTLVELKDAVIVPLTTAVEQFWARSSGLLDIGQIPDLRDLFATAGDRCVILALHHPPFRVLHQWVHGLLNHLDLSALLHANPTLHLLHGHIHRARDRAVGEGPPRVFSVDAVAESDQPLRYYDIAEGRLVPA